MQGVYKITNLLTNKVYIGSSLDIEDRFKYHRCHLINNSHDSSRLQKAFNEECNRDLNNLSFDVIEEVMGDLSHLRSREDFWIEKLKANDEDFGYNFASASVIGSSMCGKNNPFYGKKHSEEAKEKDRQAHLGFKHSEETKKLWSEQRKGESNPCYGKKLYNNGVESKFFIEGTQPNGWKLGGIKGQKSKANKASRG